MLSHESYNTGVLSKSRYAVNVFLERQIKLQYLVFISLYLDTMDNWDEKKLEEVVNKKHGEAEKKKPKTQIVCSFLELSGIYH